MAWVNVWMVKQKKILVVLGLENTDLSGLHYALSLAGRIQARVFILKLDPPHGLKSPRDVWMEEALLDVIESARQVDMTVSYQVTRGPQEKEILDLVKGEGIDLVVFGEEEADLKNSLIHVRSLVPSQIIQVRGKNNINRL